MLQKLLNHKVRIAITLLLVFSLAVIRAYEDSIFYDPLLNYFKGQYHNAPLPEINNMKMYFGLLFRYTLNSLVSLAIIYVLFKDIEAIKFASFLYFIFFVILIAAFYCIILFYGDTNKMGLFYVRRFLIQPIFLILFLPAFYYQKQKN